jgi:CHASE2 domain-containing sensor protein
MKKGIPVLIVGLTITIGCVDRKPVITIIDIGRNNRIELGRQLRTIKKYSPKIIALDFYLVPDSLDRDSVLVKELMEIENTVQIVGLHDLYKPYCIWDSLEVSDPKFKVSNLGFANLTTEDSILVKELPMRQSFNSEHIYSFSYAVAENSFGVKNKFKNTGDKAQKLKLNGLGRNFKLITRDELFSGKVNAEDLKDKIVIMGYIGEKEDYFYLDKRKTKRINGVEVHAAIIGEIINL